MWIVVVTLTNAMLVARFANEVETGIDKILTIGKKSILASTTLFSCDASVWSQKNAGSYHIIIVGTLLIAQLHSVEQGTKSLLFKTVAAITKDTQST